MSQIRNVSTIGKPENTRDTTRLNERPSIIFVFEEKKLNTYRETSIKLTDGHFRILILTNCLSLELSAHSTFPLSLQAADGIVTCRCLVIL